MKTIITFLGKFPKQTTYSYEGKPYQGQVFAEALHQFCKYDTMLVCVTEEAKASSWPVLEALKDPRIKAVDIPIGRTTDEMWETFKIITNSVNENDSVIFDITHGLRSLPFLVFLFAAYLKSAKNVTIEAIYYGAFELGDAQKGIPGPVINLSEFVSMIDWITATTRFVEIGDGQALAQLLKKAFPSSEELRDNPSTRPLKKQLQKSAEAIETISLALSITRPLETMESATKLEETLKQSAPSFYERAKPFSLLSEKVLKEYGQFALEEPKQTENFRENLQIQLEMIKWYLERNQVVQSATLAREWVVSVLVLRFGLGQQMFDNNTGRKSVEKALNNAVEKRKKEPRQITSGVCDEQLEALPEANDLAKVWGQMAELRNDIAHVGMNLTPKTATKLKNNAESLYSQLQKIAANLLA